MYDNERRLVILLSRVHDIYDYENEVTKLLDSKNIDWNLVVKYLSKTKVMGLFWNNIMRLNMEFRVPVNARRILEFYYMGNCERNKFMLKEMKRLIIQLEKNKIRVAPLKGSVLLEKIYTDFGSRQLNDIDFLIAKKDVDAIENVMFENGYRHGKLSFNKNGDIVIEKLDRFSYIVWKTKMNNLPPFFKVINYKWCRIMDVDCCFAFDYQMNFEDVENKMSKLTKEGEICYLDKEDFFIHMCCHLYKEASNAAWALLGSDLNLMKFCDIREFFYKEIDYLSWQRICKYALKYKYNKAIYYSLFFIELIYEEKIKVPYKKDLEIQEENFLYEYGKREYKDVKRWETDFIDRLFEGSKQEIEGNGNTFTMIY